MKDGSSRREPGLKAYPGEDCRHVVRAPSGLPLAAHRGWSLRPQEPSPCLLSPAGGCTPATQFCRNSGQDEDESGDPLDPGPRPCPPAPPSSGGRGPLTGRQRRRAERSIRSMLSQGRKRRTRWSLPLNAFMPSKSCRDRQGRRSGFRETAYPARERHRLIHRDTDTEKYSEQGRD